MLSILGGYRSILGITKKVATPSTTQLTDDQKALHKRARDFADKVCWAEPKESRRRWFAEHLVRFKEQEDARVAEVKTEAATA